MARPWQLLGSGRHEERRPKSSGTSSRRSGALTRLGRVGAEAFSGPRETRLVMRKIGLAMIILGLVAFVAGPAFSEDGAAVYKSKCAMCHGDNGVAKKMAEPSRNL